MSRLDVKSKSDIKLIVTKEELDQHLWLINYFICQKAQETIRKNFGSEEALAEANKKCKLLMEIGFLLEEKRKEIHGLLEGD